MNTVSIHFLGAAGTVTGSKFYLETPDINVLVDCGMFQGAKELRLMNWDPLPVPASSIDIVLLTHGHLDHTGYLPRLLKEGFPGKIIGTPPTLAITEIILMDSAKIHEEEAEQANAEGYSKHTPALPFYTVEEAKNAIDRFSPAEKDEWIPLSKTVRFRFRINGHIIGASFIELEISGKTFVFSGDVGRSKDALLPPPEKPVWADYLFLESTYGNRIHPREDLDAILSELVLTTLHNRGNLIIPSFAVERLQTLMYTLWRLKKTNKIPNIPIFVDSPMGNNVLGVFEQFPEWHKLPLNEYRAMCQSFNIISSYGDTWKTIDDPRPKVVIAGSGMVTGGRVLTYLMHLMDIPTSIVLLVGFQAEGTRGRKLLEGASELKIYGKFIPVRARIEHVESLSAHADQQELMAWAANIKNIPESVFLVHGDLPALSGFKEKMRENFNWHVIIPKLHEIVTVQI